jgi:hypothetical protein
VWKTPWKEWKTRRLSQNLSTFPHIKSVENSIFRVEIPHLPKMRCRIFEKIKKLLDKKICKKGVNICKNGGAKTDKLHKKSTTSLCKRLCHQIALKMTTERQVQITRERDRLSKKIGI